jgi:hypothetical protein
LRIADLGYFSLAVFTAMTLAKEYFLSRLQFPTVFQTLEITRPCGGPLGLHGRSANGRGLGALIGGGGATLVGDWQRVGRSYEKPKQSLRGGPSFRGSLGGCTGSSA